LFARRAALTLAILLSARLVGARPAEPDDPVANEVVRHAIHTAVSARVGSAAIVDVTSVSDVRLFDVDEDIVALPDLGARVGQPSRFTLFAAGTRRTRVGEATAVVQVTGETLRTRRAVARGEVLRDIDVEVVQAAVGHARFTRLPQLDEVVGARSMRDLPVGATLAVVDIVAEQMVRAGEAVRCRVRVGGVDITTTMVALQSGAVNDVVPVRNAETRHTVRGRVTGRGEVEVLDGR
jgi:flagella basal body P-ring formation protein FlgA